MGKFISIFDRLGLAQQFAPVVPHSERLRMFSALYVVRTECRTSSIHSDWAAAVGTSALTLITPLGECAVDENGGFQLAYERGGDPRSTREGAANGVELSSYEYKPGKAIVFGADFRHSTEPGRAATTDKPHAFLCLTFGTDEMVKWPVIAHKGLRDQSRVLSRPDGTLEQTGLGEHTADNTMSFVRQAMAQMSA